MSAPVEYAVEIHGVEFPACRHSRHIFVQPRDESYMARSAFRRHTRVRDAKGAMFEHAGAQEGREGAGDKICFVLGVRLREGLEGFVCAETVT